MSGHRKKVKALKVKKFGAKTDTSSLTKSQRVDVANTRIKSGKDAQKKATNATRGKHLSASKEKAARAAGMNRSGAQGGKASNKAELYRSANKAQSELKKSHALKKADKAAKSRVSGGKAKTVSSIKSSGLKKMSGAKLSKTGNFKGAYGGK